MPRVYRSMYRAGDLPLVEASAKGLGVRIPGDVSVRDGLIFPETGGMSVAPNWRILPNWRIPKRLKHLAPEAAGKDNYYCWRMSDGEFVSAPFFQGLECRVDHPEHGLIEPSEPVTPDEFQTRLSATQCLWVIDEE